MKIWRINVRNQSLIQESVPSHWETLGGRGLSAQILSDEVPPTCEPLGPHNKLVFAPGLLVGHRLSSCDRISVGAKSPLTGGIKESNAGGRTGLHMTHLGLKALIIEGQPRHGWWILHLSSAGPRWENASEFMGLGVYATTPALLERYGANVAIALIGPGGEMKLSSAGIQNIDKDRTAITDQCPRGIRSRNGFQKTKSDHL